MTVSVYLHDEILSLLKCFGDIDNVVNKILDAGSAGEITIMDKPAAPDRSGAKRIDVNIYNEEYLSLMRQFGAKSPRCSLRRLLYWFVEDEVYTLLDWDMKNDYVSEQEQKTKSRFIRLIEAVRNVKDKSSGQYCEVLSKIIEMLEGLVNGGECTL